MRAGILAAAFLSTFCSVHTCFSEPEEVTGEQNRSVHTLSVPVSPLQARYVRAEIFNFGPLPKGRILRNGKRADKEKPSWVFVDEIVVAAPLAD
jgi:hypothetical protein